MRYYHDDLLLSFLPLSHTFERTCGYYMQVMTGARVAYARSIPLLAEDMLTIRPTLLISVPRIYERIYGAVNAKLREGSPLKRMLFNLAVHVGWARFQHQQGRGGWKPSVSAVAAAAKAGGAKDNGPARRTLAYCRHQRSGARSGDLAHVRRSGSARGAGLRH